MAARPWTYGVLAVLSLFVLIFASCVANADARTKRSKGDKTYPLYVNEVQVSTPSVTATGQTISINPGPANNGSFPNGVLVTLAAPIPMVWAGDCGKNIVSKTCSVLMDQTRKVQVSAVPPPTPTPTPTPTLPSSNASSGASSALDIVSPEWNEVFYVRPGDTFSKYIEVQKPTNTRHWCSRTWVNFVGTHPSAPEPGLSVDFDTCEIRWTPTSSTQITRYEVDIKVGFQLSNGGIATHYRIFYVEVTNNPPAPKATPPAPAPVNNQVLGTIVGGETNPTNSIEALYACIGGSSSWLGPSSNELYIDAHTGKPRQEFQHGFITWADGEWNHYYAFSWARKSVRDLFLAPRTPVCVQGLSGQQLSIANTYNRIGGALENLAAQNNLEPEVALAVWQVESSSLGGFAGPNGQPTIRFETHWFRRFWTESAYGGNSANLTRFSQYFRASSEEVCFSGNCTDAQWQTVHGSQENRYRVLELAARLAGDEIAYRSISMGGPQIMGFNYGALENSTGARYASAAEMFGEFSRNEFSHVKGFFDYMRNHTTCKRRLDDSRLCQIDSQGQKILAVPLQFARIGQVDWYQFAAVYNGDASKESWYQGQYQVAQAVLGAQ